jgi:hypothetical protein
MIQKLAMISMTMILILMSDTMWQTQTGMALDVLE